MAITNPNRHAPVVYALDTAPVLTKSAEAIRKRLRDYLDYMKLAGKTPTAIHLTAEQYSTLTRAYGAHLDDHAPPLGGLTYYGLPVLVTGQGRAHEAS